MSRNIAVILAGGHGARMGSELPKQFLPLGGRSVIEHTLQAFQDNPAIDEIVVVMHPDHLDRMRALVQVNPCSKLAKIIPGGSERYMSSLAAIEAYMDAPDDTHLIFHDAARPLVSQRIISQVAQQLDQHRAVGVAVPTTDTIWQIDPISQQLLTAPERSHLRAAQTPQGFHLATIRDAFQRALQDPLFRCTDDCGVVLRYMREVKVHLLDGDPANLKITHPQDLLLAEALLRAKA